MWSHPVESTNDMEDRGQNNWYSWRVVGGKRTFTNLDQTDQIHCDRVRPQPFHSPWDWLFFGDVAYEMGSHRKRNCRKLKTDQNPNEPAKISIDISWSLRRVKHGDSLLKVPSQPPVHSKALSSSSMHTVQDRGDERRVSFNAFPQMWIYWLVKLELPVSMTL
jgi:hypothetical protein